MIQLKYSMLLLLTLAFSISMMSLYASSQPVPTKKLHVSRDGHIWHIVGGIGGRAGGEYIEEV